MASTVVNFPMNQDANKLHESIKQLLTANGYKETTYKKNEIVWKKGTGILLPMCFVKLDYQGNVLLCTQRVCKKNHGQNHISVYGSTECIMPVMYDLLAELNDRFSFNPAFLFS